MKAVYELPLDLSRRDALLADWVPKAVPKPESILAQNVFWFCRLRWIVIVTLTLYGCTAFFPTFLAKFGIRSPGPWPFLIAVLLTGTNLLFQRYARRSPQRDVHYRTNLWLQIVTDLMFLTVVVHYSGELQHIVAFAYLFHIVLACIFFDRRQSFIVLALALGFYGILSVFHIFDVVTAPCLFVAMPRPAIPPLFHVAQGLLFTSFASVVWYLTSYLSEIVRQRDQTLSRLNQSLIEAQAAKAQHMLRTTHELKAPFAAIQANVQLLTKGYCGPLSQEAKETLDRIDQRCRRLANEINEMLQLANLRSSRTESAPWKTINLSGVIRWCAGQVQPLATERKVSLDLDLHFCNVRGIEEQLRMLFSNLLSNAIQYSYPEGCVRVSCQRREDGGAQVIIADSGIGIEADKLPRIFEEYYRTDRAAQFNKSSSGLGLAIVRHIAQTHQIRIRVESEPDQGTVFMLDFPPVPDGQREIATMR